MYYMVIIYVYANKYFIFLGLKREWKKIFNSSI
jgi:hypothetical protein